MKTNEIALNTAQFGIDEVKAHEIEIVFAPFIPILQDLDKRKNDLQDQEVTIELCQVARQVRLDAVKFRTGIEKAHKQAKEESRRTGLAIDGWKNLLLSYSLPVEESAAAIEKHFENQEAERIAALEAERIELMKPFGMDCSFLQLGQMPEPIWDAFLLGQRTAFEAKKAAELKAEEDRINAEQEKIKNEARRQAMYELGLRWDGQSFTFKDINFHWTDLVIMTSEEFHAAVEGAKARKLQIEQEEAVEAERIRKENEALRIKAEAAEKEAQAERLKAEAERREQDRARQAAEARVKAEREAAEQKAREEKEKIEKELQAERDRVKKMEEEKREEDKRIQAEELKKAEAAAREVIRLQNEERMAEAARIEAEKVAAARPDKDKMITAISGLRLPELSLNTETGIEGYEFIKSAFEDFKKWAFESIEKI
jgi:hypothetical protein